jgi:DNA-binding IclR family transcriptional regulator
MASDARFPVLGRQQRMIMNMLFEHGHWSPESQWCVGSLSTTHHALMALERRGLVQHTGPRYWLTPPGWSWLAASTALDLRLLSYGTPVFEKVTDRLQAIASMARLTGRERAPVNWRGDRS